MAFTYVGDLSTDRDKVRFYLDDTVSGSGPRPQDANFTDAEIDGLITAEGTWQRAVAGGFERLAAEWTKYPTFQADNFAISRSHITRNHQSNAQYWRDRYGRKDLSEIYGDAGSRAITRADAYSTDKDSENGS